jgi:hypothetical protein
MRYLEYLLGQESVQMHFPKVVYPFALFLSVYAQAKASLGSGKWQ